MKSGLFGAGSTAHRTFQKDMRTRDLRVKATFRVRYKTMDDLVVAYSGNLSRGGLFLRTDKLLPPETVVRLQVELPDGRPELTIPCRVVFVREEQDASRGVHRGMGLTFIDPDDAVRRRLEWFILNSAPEPNELKTFSERRLDVVVLDDDPLQCERAAAPFRERGDTVRIANDGLDGLAMCLKQAPDVILSDVQMPRMDGWQFVRMLRARTQFRIVPVLFLTTLSGEQDRLLGYKLGVDDYIGKPYEASDLIARVDRAVLRAQQQKDAEPGAHQALRGDLEQVGLPSILSFLEVEKRSGVLRVGPQKNAQVTLYDGRVVRIELDDALPDEPLLSRFFRVLDIGIGRFEFRAEDVSDEFGAGLAISAALLQHAKHADEQQHG